jgi:hypothetical protein
LELNETTRGELKKNICRMTGICVRKSSVKQELYEQLEFLIISFNPSEQDCFIVLCHVVSKQHCFGLNLRGITMNFVFH